MNSLNWDFDSIKIQFQEKQTIVNFRGLEEPVVIREMTPSEILENLLDLCIAVSPSHEQTEQYLRDLRTHISKYFFDQELFRAWSRNIENPQQTAKILQFRRPQSPARK